ncbi:hypothetical protein GXP70_27230 [Paenibacillus lycopersici]|uniref:Uncharacterized protein n=1 Tax=Paenibacillus lycopersici TaxID=2704462 RepID=A0A6C0G4V8_9BACL|nr:hypothetical protein [Paenibacillus lycopersici]QHT63293.1 hypothetical protein GXP70_27230 [Paenibacillus lycopersici]
MRQPACVWKSRAGSNTWTSCGRRLNNADILKKTVDFIEKIPTKNVDFVRWNMRGLNSFQTIYDELANEYAWIAK